MRKQVTGFPAGLALAIFLFLCAGIIPQASARELHIFVGAGLRQPVDQLALEFEKQSGHRVFADYGGSGQLLTKIEASSQGDLFIPGAVFYIEKLQQQGKVRSSRPLVRHTPVIGVNPKATDRVSRFEDLAKPGIRLAIGDPKAMAFGRTALSILDESGQKEAILKNVKVYGATVKQLALYVAQGVVDAAIIGRSDACQNAGKIIMVSIPEAYFESEIVAAAVLQSAENPELAETFAKFLSSDHAVTVFEKFGFLPLTK